MTKQDIKENHDHIIMASAKGMFCAYPECKINNSLPSQQIERSLIGFKGTFYRIDHCSDNKCHHIYDDQGNAQGLDDLYAYFKQELEACAESARKEAVEKMRERIEVRKYRDAFGDQVIKVDDLINDLDTLQPKGEDK